MKTMEKLGLVCLFLAFHPADYSLFSLILFIVIVFFGFFFLFFNEIDEWITKKADEERKKNATPKSRT